MTKLVEIELIGHGRGTVRVDGVDLDGVMRVAFSAKPGGLNRVWVLLAPSKVQIKAAADMRQKFKEL